MIPLNQQTLNLCLMKYFVINLYVHTADIDSALTHPDSYHYKRLCGPHTPLPAAYHNTISSSFCLIYYFIPRSLNICLACYVLDQNRHFPCFCYCDSLLYMDQVVQYVSSHLPSLRTSPRLMLLFDYHGNQNGRSCLALHSLP